MKTIFLLDPKIQRQIEFLKRAFTRRAGERNLGEEVKEEFLNVFRARFVVERMVRGKCKRKMI